MTKLEQSLKDRDLIDIGDKVNVTTEVSNFDGIVKFKPRDTGDCWGFERLDTGEPTGHIIYVMNFIEINKYNYNTHKENRLPF